MQEPKITAATLARTAVLALALTNQLLSAAVKPVLRRIPILEEQMKVANHRIQDLEQQQKERYGYYAGT